MYLRATLDSKLVLVFPKTADSTNPYAQTRLDDAACIPFVLLPLKIRMRNIAETNHQLICCSTASGRGSSQQSVAFLCLAFLCTFLVFSFIYGLLDLLVFYLFLLVSLVFWYFVFSFCFFVL
jgi:Flp pilus assembly protein TadB